jgi:hypothetical protein|nr:hypothetical protein [Kofleriaceae bacterium]
MLSGLISIAGGILAAAALIIARKPDAKVLIDKLTPYQGWIGIVMFGWGIHEVIGVLTHMGMMTSQFGYWLFWTLTGASDLLVGFLLGFGLLVKYALGKNPTALARGQAIRQKLATYQGLFGIVSIAMGVLFIVLYGI